MIKKGQCITGRIWLLLYLTFNVCTAHAVQDSSDIQGNRQYYAKINFWYRMDILSGSNQHGMSNHSDGIMVSVGTPVNLVGISNNVISIRIPSQGDTLVKIINSRAYSGASTDTVFHRMFSTAQDPINAIRTQYRNAVLEGRIAMGMTKQEVLMARGYPPWHQTYGLESLVWKYWKESSDVTYVVFDNNDVVIELFE